MQKQVYIIHGYGASPESHWFPWLQSELEKEQIEATILTMPSPEEPDFFEWQEALKNQINTITQGTYFVAHSLGTVSIMHYLSQLSELSHFGGLLLVSPLTQMLPALPELDTFIQSSSTAIDFAKLKKQTFFRKVVAAKDDSIVPYLLSKEVAEQTSADFYPVNKGGHFLESDGFTQFSLIKKLLDFE